MTKMVKIFKLVKLINGVFKFIIVKESKMVIPTVKIDVLGSWKGHFVPHK